MRFTVKRHYKAEVGSARCIADPDTVHSCFIVGRDVGGDVAGHVVQHTRGPAVGGEHVSLNRLPFLAGVPHPSVVPVLKLIWGRVGQQVKRHRGRCVHNVSSWQFIWRWAITPRFA